VPDRRTDLAFRSSVGRRQSLWWGPQARVLVSESAVALLSHDELHIALKHEDAHLRARRQLKKLVFLFVLSRGWPNWKSACRRPPIGRRRCGRLERRRRPRPGCRLVKLSRLLPVGAAPVCTVGFVTGSIGTRVERLLAWK